MKKWIFCALVIPVVLSVFLFDYAFYFSPQHQSEKIAGFSYPKNTSLVFKRKHGSYKLFKWSIPKERFASIIKPKGVEESPFSPLQWKSRAYDQYSDGADSFLEAGDIPSDSESIHYRTSHHAVELIRSKSESTIIVISIYNN